MSQEKRYIRFDSKISLSQLLNFLNFTLFLIQRKCSKIRKRKQALT